jgi:hypothetical protein
LNNRWFGHYNVLKSTNKNPQKLMVLGSALDLQFLLAFLPVTLLVMLPETPRVMLLETLRVMLQVTPPVLLLKSV